MTETQELVDAIVRGIQEKKGFDIVTADLSNIVTAPAKYFVIASGNIPQHVEALSDSVWEFAHTEVGEKPSVTTGYTNAEWIVMDYGTVIVHLFVPDAREYYDIEHLWEDSRLTEIPNLD